MRKKYSYFEYRRILFFKYIEVILFLLYFLFYKEIAKWNYQRDRLKIVNRTFEYFFVYIEKRSGRNYEKRVSWCDESYTLENIIITKQTKSIMVLALRLHPSPINVQSTSVHVLLKETTITNNMCSLLPRSIPTQKHDMKCHM